MKQRKAIILSSGSGSGLHPTRIVAGRQFLPVYDNAMIYLPLSTLMPECMCYVPVMGVPQETPRITQANGARGVSCGIECRAGGIPQFFGKKQADLQLTQAEVFA